MANIYFLFGTLFIFSPVFLLFSFAFFFWCLYRVNVRFHRKG